MSDEPPSDSRRAPCECFLCHRHRRLRYVKHVLQRAGDEPAAHWLDVIFDHLLDVEAEMEMERHAE